MLVRKLTMSVSSGELGSFLPAPGYEVKTNLDWISILVENRIPASQPALNLLSVQDWEFGLKLVCFRNWLNKSLIQTSLLESSQEAVGAHPSGWMVLQQTGISDIIVPDCRQTLEPCSLEIHISFVRTRDKFHHLSYEGSNTNFLIVMEIKFKP